MHKTVNYFGISFTDLTKKKMEQTKCRVSTLLFFSGFKNSYLVRAVPVLPQAPGTF